MNIRTLFVADMQKRQYITVDYCPTDEMILDLFTTPAGRAKLCHLRNIIMNISDYEYGPVDMDKLMTVHNKNMFKRFGLVLEGSLSDSHNMDEHNFSKDKHLAEVRSQV